MAGAKKPAKDDAKGDAAPKKSKKKLIIIGVAALLLLGGGGGGGAWFFLVHKKADAHAAPKEEAPKPPIYVALEPFTVNLQPEDGEKFLQVKINLQVTEPPQVDLIKAQMPQVRSRILTLLSSGKASELLTIQGKTTLAQQITDAVNQPFVPKGPPQKVTAVFFSDFIIQ